MHSIHLDPAMSDDERMEKLYDGRFVRLLDLTGNLAMAKLNQIR
jgi:hypothetical protein